MDSSVFSCTTACSSCCFLSLSSSMLQVNLLSRTLWASYSCCSLCSSSVPPNLVVSPDKTISLFLSTFLNTASINKSNNNAFILLLIKKIEHQWEKIICFIIREYKLSYLLVQLWHLQTTFHEQEILPAVCYTYPSHSLAEPEDCCTHSPTC